MVKTEMLASVILITYNHQDYISRAIDSILEQETNFDFKIQIFEDCSTDDTKKICKEYAAKYPEKIELILREKNIGASKNALDAMRQIKAKYWAYLEGDDYWCDKNKLQLAVDILERNPHYSMTGHNTKILDFKTRKESYTSQGGNFSNGKHKIGDNIFSFENCPYIHTSSRVHRTALVDFQKETLFMSYDLIWLFKFLSQGDLYYIDKVMSVYNLTGVGSHSGINKAKQNLQYFNMMYKLNKYFNYKYNNFFIKNIKNFIYPKRPLILHNKIIATLEGKNNHISLRNRFCWFVLHLFVNLKYRLFKL